MIELLTTRSMVWLILSLYLICEFFIFTPHPNKLQRTGCAGQVTPFTPIHILTIYILSHAPERSPPGRFRVV